MSNFPSRHIPSFDGISEPTSVLQLQVRGRKSACISQLRPVKQIRRAIHRCNRHRQQKPACKHEDQKIEQDEISLFRQQQHTILILQAELALSTGTMASGKS